MIDGLYKIREIYTEYYRKQETINTIIFKQILINGGKDYVGMCIVCSCLWSSKFTEFCK